MTGEIETLRARIAELEKVLDREKSDHRGLRNRLTGKLGALTKRAEKAEAALTEARERLEREKWELQAKLAKAERDADIREDFAHDYGHDEGFRAGIEAAAGLADKEARYWSSLCNDDERVNWETFAKEIRDLTPTDKPAVPSVAEETEGPYTCRSCCAATWNDSDVCDDCALAAREGE